MLWDYIAERDIDAALSEVSAEDVDEKRTRGRVRRVGTSKRTLAAVEMLRRYEVAAMHARDRLGLSPLARSRIGRDVAMANKLDLARMWSSQDEGGI